MKIKINVKGVSNRENKIMHLTYEDVGTFRTLRDFLAETARKRAEVAREHLASGECRS